MKNPADEAQHVRNTAYKTQRAKNTADQKQQEHVHSESCEHGEPLAPYVREAPKTGRNDPCPCGSGKKFKKCCGAQAQP